MIMGTGVQTYGVEQVDGGLLRYLARATPSVHSTLQTYIWMSFVYCMFVCEYITMYKYKRLYVFNADGVSSGLCSISLPINMYLQMEMCVFAV